MEYNIIKNAGPIPPVIRRGKGVREFTPKYPFHLMEIGDALDVIGEGPVKPNGRYSNWSGFSAAAWTYGKNHSKKFVIRRISEDTLRIWREA